MGFGDRRMPLVKGKKGTKRAHVLRVTMACDGIPVLSPKHKTLSPILVPKP